jgi:hypothetical protein
MTFVGSVREVLVSKEAEKTPDTVVLSLKITVERTESCDVD